jgi:fused signal recognition particle receptor
MFRRSRTTQTSTVADEAAEPAIAADYEHAVARTRARLGGRLRALLRGGAISDETWQEVEEALIAADVGGELATKVVERARARRDVENAEAAVMAELLALFAPRDPTPWPRIPAPGVPAVVLVVGVNGTGKTTTIAKLAHRFSTRGARVLLAAADTFRPAAIEQLQVWASRVNVPVVAHAAGADPSAVVYDALDAAAARGSDVVIADTAGRLHTKSNLMDELAKIRRTINKRVPEATPEVLFVLDATTGQNGLAQAKAFHEAAPLSGIVLTKLDSTARGGIAFAVEQSLGVPVLFVGVGEKVDDLLDFNPNAFVEALFA